MFPTLAALSLETICILPGHVFCSFLIAINLVQVAPGPRMKQLHFVCFFLSAHFEKKNPMHFSGFEWMARANEGGGGGGKKERCNWPYLFKPFLHVIHSL